MAHDRNVAGIRCTEILQGLSAYLDGELPQETCDRVNAHLRACCWCEDFGGDVAQVLRQLREQLAEPVELPLSRCESIVDRIVSS